MTGQPEHFDYAWFRDRESSKMSREPENPNGMVLAEGGEYLRPGPSSETRELRQVENFKMYLAELAVQKTQEENKEK